MPPVRIVEIRDITCPFPGGQIENLLTGHYNRMLQRTRGVTVSAPTAIPFTGIEWTLLDTVFAGSYLLFREVKGPRRHYLLVNHFGVSEPAGETTVAPAVFVVLAWDDPPADGNHETALHEEIVAVLGIHKEWLKANTPT